MLKISDENRECPFCKGNAIAKSDLTFTNDDKTITGLKGWLCQGCNEMLYNEESVERLEKEFG